MKIETEEGSAVHSVTLEVKDRLLPCPFCGSRDIELQHTWTASYWLECKVCGCELHDNGRIGSHANPECHLTSARRVIKRWNVRTK